MMAASFVRLKNYLTVETLRMHTVNEHLSPPVSFVGNKITL